MFRVLGRRECSIMNAADFLDMFLGDERPFFNIMLDNYKLKLLNDQLEDENDQFRADQAYIAAEEHELGCTRCESLIFEQNQPIDISRDCCNASGIVSSSEEVVDSENEKVVVYCPPPLNEKKRKLLRDKIRNRRVRRRLFADK